MPRLRRIQVFKGATLMYEYFGVVPQKGSPIQVLGIQMRVREVNKDRGVAAQVLVEEYDD